MVFPGQAFIHGKLEKVMVEAHKIIRDFLLSQRYFRKENEFNQLLDFSEIVRSRSLYSRYQPLMAKLQKIQDEAPLNNTEYYQRKFLLEYAIYDEATIRNPAKGDLNIPNTLHALELHYYINRLVLLNQYLLQLKITHLEIPEDIKILVETGNVPEKHLEASSSILINYTIFNLLKKDHPEAVEIQELFDLLIRHEKKLEAESLREFYTHLRNLCILALSADFEKREMEHVLHTLYKDNLARGYLHYEGKINRSRYWAVSNHAVNVRDYLWAHEFIEKYKDEIRDENETRDIYRLNLANYYFAVGRYADCLDNIPPTSPYVDYLLLGKRLELKALYELRSDLLSFKLDAFKMFLSRTSAKLLSAAQKQVNSDFANLLHQLVYSAPGDPKRSDVLLKRIHAKKQAVEWRWLLEKAKAMKI